MKTKAIRTRAGKQLLDIAFKNGTNFSQEYMPAQVLYEVAKKFAEFTGGTAKSNYYVLVNQGLIGGGSVSLIIDFREVATLSVVVLPK